ncbi:MAG TPA: DUF1501 domain-containing protein [Candidatus Saccharimonadales bacterium]|nr:DUF1501 domain-containing protein [Candidatus Saccharimonadales bacterium]
MNRDRSVPSSAARRFKPPSGCSGPLLSRRALLQRAGGGVGWLALATLLQPGGLVRAASTALLNPLAAKRPHLPARAKSIIWIFANGGPSQVDTFDYKPDLVRMDGKKLEGFDNKTGFFQDAVGGLMKSPFAWQRYGQSGTWISDLFPHLSRHADKMAFLHSCWTQSNNHSPALFMMNTGTTRMGFPCVGSWVTYGLGSESANLPSFVVMSDPLNRGLPKGNANNWGAGFLPGIYQGTWVRPQGDPIDNLQRAAALTDGRQRAQLDLLARLNRRGLDESAAEAELSARIETFELAYRMQTAAPEAFDVRRESAETQSLYGLDQKHCAHFAAQCLMARRLVERGVRFVQIYSGGMENQLSWDCHADLVGNHRGFARETDQPVAALLEDLHERGLLDETLVVWGGEFGRLPLAQKGDKPGRDHNPHAFTVWMAGGGVRGGFHYGETDEIGFKAAVNKVHVRDLHATLLAAMGLNHEQLTYHFQGLDQRLTGFEGAQAVRELFA